MLSLSFGLDEMLKKPIMICEFNTIKQSCQFMYPFLVGMAAVSKDLESLFRYDGSVSLVLTVYLI